MASKRKILCRISRGQEFPVVPPQFTPIRRPHGTLTGPQAVSGPTRLHLLHVQQSHSERYSTSRPPLPCTNRQLSGGAFWICTGFHPRVIGMYCLVYHFDMPKSIRKNEKIYSASTLFLVILSPRHAHLFFKEKLHADIAPFFLCAIMQGQAGMNIMRRILPSPPGPGQNTDK